MLTKNTHNQLRDSLLQGLLYVEKFKRSEFAMNEALAAQWLGLTRKQLKPIYQKFKNNCKFSDAELKTKGEAIATDFDKALAGGDL